MLVLPGLVARFDWAQSRPSLASLVIVAGVFLLAALGQGFLLTLGRRARRHLHSRASRSGDAFFGAVATVAAIAALSFWCVPDFLAVRGGCVLVLMAGYAFAMARPRPVDSSRGSDRCSTAVGSRACSMASVARPSRRLTPRRRR